MTSSQLRGRCWTSSTWNSPATCSAAPTWPTMRACSPTAAGGSASAFTSKVCEWLLVFNLKKGSIITSNCCFFPQYFLCPYKYQYASRIPYFFFTLLPIILLFRKALEVWDPLPESERFGNTLHVPGTYNFLKNHKFFSATFEQNSGKIRYLAAVVASWKCVFLNLRSTPLLENRWGNQQPTTFEQPRMFWSGTWNSTRRPATSCRAGTWRLTVPTPATRLCAGEINSSK